jgi:hypothetical protein
MAEILLSTLWTGKMLKILSKQSLNIYVIFCHLRGLNPEQFQSLCRDWVKEIPGDMAPEIIAIDGKLSRHSFDND